MTAKKQKRQKRVDLVCILTGEVIQKQPRARIDKQAKKLKFEDTDDYIKYFVSKRFVNSLNVKKQ
jgi:hypothetical protein